MHAAARKFVRWPRRLDHARCLCSRAGQARGHEQRQCDVSAVGCTCDSGFFVPSSRGAGHKQRLLASWAWRGPPPSCLVWPATRAAHVAAVRTRVCEPRLPDHAWCHERRQHGAAVGPLKLKMLLATTTATAKRAFRPGGTPSVVFPYLNPPLPLLRLSTFSLHLSPYLLYVSLPLSHSLLFPLLSLSLPFSPYHLRPTATHAPPNYN